MEKGIYVRETGEQRPEFHGNRGTKTILGNRVHKKTNFIFLGTGNNLFQGNNGTGTPWAGLIYVYGKFCHRFLRNYFTRDFEISYKYNDELYCKMGSQSPSA